MNRLEEVRKIVDEAVLEIGDPFERRCAYLHLYGVAHFASLLALKRGLDPELSTISAMLHDVYAYKTGISRFHDQNGAELARPVIRDMKMFDKAEQVLILSAVFHHSDKEHVHKPYDELLKDADAFQHFIYNTGQPIVEKDATRVRGVLYELGLSYNFEISDSVKQDGLFQVAEDKRGRLADIAQSLAAREIVGSPDVQDYRKICSYLPDKEIHEDIKDRWCAAFVYHCCMEAGFYLPIRHPLVFCRFAGVAAWLDWARLPETRFFHPLGADGFTPARGDIVIYDKLITKDHHDHIGIVLSYDGEKMLAAEGNVDNRNKSGIAPRSGREKIAGFIRIDNGFRYECTGREYDPEKLVRDSAFEL